MQDASRYVEGIENLKQQSHEVESEDHEQHKLNFSMKK